jgi:hypothetical protein
MSEIGTKGTTSTTEAKQLGSAASTDLAAKKRAIAAAQDAICNVNEPNSDLPYRRYASEAAARAVIGGDAVDLDIATAGHKGHNFPTYDISSSSEIASVKTHWDNTDAYISDFHRQLGWGRSYDQGLSPVQLDARNIIQARDRGEIPVPRDLENANLAQVTDYLNRQSVLRIPDDHVKEVRDKLETLVTDLPHNYHLPDNPSQEQIKSVLDRIRPMGLTSTELREMIELRMRSVKG